MSQPSAETTFLETYNPDEVERISEFLGTLLPYMTEPDFYLVGGLPIRYHITHAGLIYPHKPLNDIDIVVKSIETLDPSLTDKLMVAHFHKDTPDSFYVALVHPKSRIKADIFSNGGYVANTLTVPLADMQLPIVTAEAQLAATVRDLLKPSKGEAVDPKQFDDAEHLLAFVDMPTAEQAWNDDPQNDGTLSEAYLQALRDATQYPQLVRPKPHSRPKPYDCSDCIDDPKFPITPMIEVCEALGHSS